MSPSRRDFLHLLVATGAAASLPSAGSAAAHEPTVHAQLITIRDTLETIRDTYDVDDDFWDRARVDHLVMETDEAIMALCPHDPTDYYDHPEHRDVICCPLCRAERRTDLPPPRYGSF